MSKSKFVFVCIFVTMLFTSCANKFNNKDQINFEKDLTSEDNEHISNKPTLIKEDITGNSAGNVVNRALIMKNGSWTYGILKNNSLSKSKDGDSDCIILDDNTVQDVNVVSDYIYYRKFDGPKYDGTILDGYIRRIKLDGTQETKITDVPVKYFYIQNGFIYYSINDKNESKIVQTDLDGKSEVIIYKDKQQLKWFQVYKENIYILDKNSRKLHKYDINKKTDKEISKSFKEKGINLVSSFIVDDEFIYFNNLEEAGKQGYLANGLYKMTKEGDNIQLITEDKVSEFNIDNDWIYVKTDYPSGVYKIKKDGSNRFKLADINARHLNVTENWIYCENEVKTEGKFIKIKTDGSGYYEKLW